MSARSVAGDREYYLTDPSDPALYLCVVRHWLPEATATRCFDYFKETYHWEQRPSRFAIPIAKRVPGESIYHPEPRLTYYAGDHDAPPHRYSGRDHALEPWDPVARTLRDRVVRETGLYFDSALFNYYRSGNDHIGAHSDDAHTVGERGAVVGLNFGASRELRFLRDGKLVVAVTLNNSDSYIMSGKKFQQIYKHEILPTKKPTGERISLTFRNLSKKYIPYTGQKPDE